MAWRPQGRFLQRVAPTPDRTPDWRDAEAYAPLLDVGRPGFAWEWLRRDRGYCTAAAGAGRSHGLAPAFIEADERAARWGLHAFERPDRDALAARPVWRRELFPSVLEAEAVDQGPDEDRLEIGRLRRFVTSVRDLGGREHLLLSDGRRAIRLDILSGSLSERPVLRYRLAGLSGVQPPLLALRQLLALWSTGRFSRALHPREQRAARWILLLRASDGLAAGASQRDIAAALLGREAADRRWRVEASSLRSRAQRLVRDARRMAGGGYLSLLGGA